jgi:glycosyltransferase involved in cell wall biosynthesis
MAACIPVITSPTSANAYAIEHLKSGYHASDENEWITQITKAFNERKILSEMGAVGQQRVTREFDINLVFNKLLNIISTL